MRSEHQDDAREAAERLRRLLAVDRKGLDDVERQDHDERLIAIGVISLFANIERACAENREFSTQSILDRFGLSAAAAKSAAEPAAPPMSDAIEEPLRSEELAQLATASLVILYDCYAAATTAIVGVINTPASARDGDHASEIADRVIDRLDGEWEKVAKELCGRPPQPGQDGRDRLRCIADWYLHRITDDGKAVGRLGAELQQAESLYR